MLKQRFVTAVVLVVAALSILFFFSPQVFCVALGMVALGATWEWSNLMAVKRVSIRVLYLLIMLFFLFNSLFIPLSWLLLTGFVWWLLALSLVMLYPRASTWWANSQFVRGIMGVLVIVPCWAALNFIRNQTEGVFALLFLFVLIWGADSVAYFVGKEWGKTKLAPKVSPGKSVQGAIGAVLFSIVVTALVLVVMKMPLPGWPWAILLSVATVIFSIVGDLLESMLKRQVGLKDSGNLLPGHGGLLDRIDSLTAAAPIFAFGALMMSKYL